MKVEPNLKLEWKDAPKEFPIHWVDYSAKDKTFILKIECMYPVFIKWEVSILNGIKKFYFPGTTRHVNDIKEKAEELYFNILEELTDSFILKENTRLLNELKFARNRLEKMDIQTEEFLDNLTHIKFAIDPNMGTPRILAKSDKEFKRKHKL